MLVTTVCQRPSQCHFPSPCLRSTTSVFPTLHIGIDSPLGKFYYILSLAVDERLLLSSYIHIDHILVLQIQYVSLKRTLIHSLFSYFSTKSNSSPFGFLVSANGTKSTSVKLMLVWALPFFISFQFHSSLLLLLQDSSSSHYLFAGTTAKAS